MKSQLSLLCEGSEFSCCPGTCCLPPEWMGYSTPYPGEWYCQVGPQIKAILGPGTRESVESLLRFSFPEQDWDCGSSSEEGGELATTEMCLGERPSLFQSPEYQM